MSSFPRTALFCITLSGAILFSQMSMGQAPDERSVDLTDHRADYGVLAPESEQSRSGESTFHADAATGRINVFVQSNVVDLAVAIDYPGGQSPITPLNVDEFGGGYAEFAVAPDPDGACFLYPWLCRPGDHYQFTFDSQGAGDYTVHFVAPVTMSVDPGLVLVEFNTDSAIGAAMIPTPRRVADGADVTLTVLAFNGAVPAAGATVTAQVADPVTESYGQPIVLLDDGLGFDDMANDGLYSVAYTPPTGSLGTYRVKAQIVGAGGSFERQAATQFETFSRPAKFASIPAVAFNDRDDDIDTLIDRIDVAADVVVSETGDYRLLVVLEETGSSETVVGWKNIHLVQSASAQTVSAEILASEVLAGGFAGPSITLAFNSFKIIAYGPTGDDPASVSDEYTASGTPVSPSYLLTKFDRPDITSTGSVVVSTDPAMPPYDELRVDVGLYVQIDGTYDYSASIVDSCGEYFGTIGGQQEFADGIDGNGVVAQQLNLVFPGSMSGGHGVDGPYHIEELVIYGPASYTNAFVTQTSAYAATGFVGYSPAPDCDGDADPDRCEIVNGTAPDCNLDTVPDDCCSGDLDFDGQVNSVDEGLLQSQYGCLPAAGGCTLCDRSDLDGDGAVNPVDLGLLQAQSGACGGLSPFGGGGPGGGGSPLTGMWEITLKDVRFEVQPAGGGAPVDVLEANTEYEIHYVAEHPQTNGYALFAVTGTDQAGFASASAPRDGDWADAGRLYYMDRRNDRRERRRAYGYSDDHHRNQQVTNNFHPYGPDRHAGQRGHLCTFTTAGPGELNLHLYLWMLEEAEQSLVLMESRLAATVR
jgi:hypothetical protein